MTTHSIEYIKKNKSFLADTRVASIKPYNCFAELAYVLLYIYRRANRCSQASTVCTHNIWMNELKKEWNICNIEWKKEEEKVN